MLTVLDDFVWSLRRAGVEVAPRQVIDAARALGEIGLDDRTLVREALGCVLVTRGRDRAAFEAAFSRFFGSTGVHARDLEGRLRAAGFGESTLARLREIVAALVEAEGPGGEVGALAGLLAGASSLSHALLGGAVRRALARLANPLQVGYFAQQTLTTLGAGRAARGLGRLRHELIDAFGDEGARLAEALTLELSLARDEVRRFVEARLAPEGEVEPGRARSPRDVTFAALSDQEAGEVRRAVRALALRLRGAARLRERKARRGGRVDVRRTVRLAARTGGVPLTLARRTRRRDRPRLWVLCDVSDSVRAAATFMLEFVAAVHDIFARTRAFVFVADVGEATHLFARETPAVAAAKAFAGEVVAVTHNSNYGRVLARFEGRYGRAIDRRSTVVILGDGRTNYQPACPDALARLRARAGALLWLCPEPRALWGTGDSAMPLYAPLVTAVLPASTARELEAAARHVVARR